MDKRDRAAKFRERLGEALALAGLSRSALGRATGVDRSTISALMAAGETRLPNAQLAADCAEALGVSADWLLGLSERPERAGDLVAAAVKMAAAERAAVDEEIFAWHREADGYKVRHVPASMPDALKTEAVLRWEYEAHLGRTPDQAVNAMVDRMDWLRAGRSDHEIAVPRHEVESFARGEGYWRGLPAAARREQLVLLARRARELYPGLRLFFFDARRVFSAPMTVFGPLLAVIYVGQVYLAFRGEDRVRSLTGHFDWLVRECEVDAREAADWLEALAAQVPTAHGEDAALRTSSMVWTFEMPPET
ncbi:MAG: helix-turn-helix transcriptional regulator [Pseudomonadota bacterium]